MRRIGNLQDESVACRFCDYLLTLKIDSVIERGDGDSDPSWDIWIRSEEDVDRAREEWQAFLKTPDDPRYQVEKQAENLRNRRIAERKRQEERFAKQERRITEQRVSRPLGSGSTAGNRQERIPVTIAIIAISILSSLTSNFGNPRGSRAPNVVTLEQKTYDAMSFVNPSDYVIGGDAFASIKKGQVWRFITPMFLHGDAMHLAFNMLWLFVLGSAIERLHGSLFLLVIVFTTQTAGMLLQVMLPDATFIPEALRGSPFAIGASGAVYGLFGFLWIRPYFDQGYPIHLVPMNVALMLGWLVLCMTPMVKDVANGAHLGGLVSGMLMAVAGPMIRR